VLSHQIVVAAIVPSCWRGKKIKEKHKHRIKKIREFIDEKNCRQENKEKQMIRNCRHGLQDKILER